MKGGSPPQFLGDLNDFAGADTGGASVDGLRRAVHESADAAEIRIPPPARQIMRVTDSVAKMWGLTADVTRPWHSSPSSDWLKLSATYLLYHNQARFRSIGYGSHLKNRNRGPRMSSSWSLAATVNPGRAGLTASLRSKKEPTVRKKRRSRRTAQTRRAAGCFGAEA